MEIVIPKSVLEKVFVARGGNEPLANLIDSKTTKLGFDPIVGGESPTELFIGTHPGRMRSC